MCFRVIKQLTPGIALSQVKNSAEEQVYTYTRQKLHFLLIKFNSTD